MDVFLNNGYILQVKYHNNHTHMLCFPNAKINMGLNIIRKGPTDFIILKPYFVPSDLADILEFVPEPDLYSGDLHFSTHRIPIDGSAGK